MSAAVAFTVLVVASRARGPADLVNPLTTLKVQRPTQLQGHVVTRLDAGPYVYVLVEDRDGATQWVAALATSASLEREVQVTVFGAAPRFQSRRLGRAFAPLLFGSIRSPVSPHQESQ